MNITVDMATVYDSLAYQGTWVWVDQITGRPMPAATNLLQHVTRNLTRTYTCKRDQYASRLGCGNLQGGWQDNTLGLAAAVYRLPYISLSAAARAVRFVLDKHFHRGNIAKGCTTEDSH